MKVKILGTVLLCAILLLTGTACKDASPTGGGGGTTTDGMTATEIMEAATSDDAQFDTCRFLMDMVMGMTGIDMIVEGNGAIDYPNEKMRIEMDMDMNIDVDTGMGTVSSESTMTMDMYAIDDWIYMKMDMVAMGMDMSIGWLKVQDMGEIWEEEDIAGQQLELMAEYVSVALLGSENVNGIDCYKLSVIPDLEELWDWYMTQEGVEGEGLEFDAGEAIDDFDITVWVAKDTNYIVKTDIEMKMTIEGESVDMTMSMLFWDHNEPVYISLPAEAADAEEWDLSEWESW